MIETYILKPNNELIKIDYYKIRSYCELECKKLIVEDQIKKEYDTYIKNYNNVNPSFDFLINEMKYIIINPFKENNTYLMSKDNKYYIMELDGKSYDELISKSPLQDFDFLPASDKNLSLESKILNKCEYGFLVDLDGNFYFNKYMDRHLKMARTILNQKLINSLNLNIKYDKFIKENGYNKKLDFLCLKLGYMIGIPSNSKTITYNSKLLNIKQLNILEYYQNKNYKIEEIRNLYKGKER